jgi:hypothetical protein
MYYLGMSKIKKGKVYIQSENNLSIENNCKRILTSKALKKMKKEIFSLD